MTKLSTQNGKIDKVRVFFEDHGCLVVNVDVKLGGNGYVTFGNVSLGNINEPLVRKSYKEGDPTNYCGYYISQVLGVFDAQGFDDLKGQACRVILNNNLCIGIQNFMDFDQYFIPRKDFDDDFENEYDLSEILK